MKHAFHTSSITQCFEYLKSAKTGLTTDEAQKRLEHHGPNQLPSAGSESTVFRIFVAQFTSPFVIVLIIAAVVSVVMMEWLDAIVIGITVLINGAVGFVQEYQADQALKKLRNMVTYTATVLRGGTMVQIPSSEVVIGDIMLLHAGDKVQADGRVLEVSDCEVSEAVLTGESEPQRKTSTTLTHHGHVPIADRSNMVYRGTVVTKGRATILVSGVGGDTEIGKIATLVQETKDEVTPLQTQIVKLGKILGGVVVAMCVVIMALGLLSRSPYIENYVQLFKIAVAIAVAVIPEGLAISMTVILAIGMKHILKRNALVRKLLAAETLGSVSVICTDKTGTLTEGNMSVARVVTAQATFGAEDIRSNDFNTTDDEYIARRAIEFGVLANDGVIQHADKSEEEWSISGNLTDIAFIRYGMQSGLEKLALDQKYVRIDDIPFDSKKRYMATLHIHSRHHLVIVKGAPEQLYDQVTTYAVGDNTYKKWTSAMRTYFTKKEHMLTSKGFRVIAVAYSELPLRKKHITDKDISKLTFVGIVALADRIRPEVHETVRLAETAGIRVIMMTGDHARTAHTIAREAGIGNTDIDRVCEGGEVDAMSDKELLEKLSRTSVFARVEPKHKIRMVRALQSQGHVVAMTGDGVNDAPALKGSDIGVAVGSGTDVAKEIADIVLLDNSFTTIVAAVEEGRGIYQNIKKVILYLLSCSFSEAFLILSSIIAGLPLAVLPTQVLWVNLIQGSFPVMALAFEHGEHENMQDLPRPRNAPIFDRDMRTLIVAKIIFSNILLFIMFVYFWRTTGDIMFTRTVMFMAFAVEALFYIYALRSMRRPLIRMRWFDNIYLNISVIFGWTMLLLAVYFPPFQTLLSTVPLGAFEWLVLLVFSLLSMAFVELMKLFFRRRSARDAQTKNTARASLH